MDSENVKVTAEEKDGEEVRDNELPREDEEEDEEEEEEEEMEEGPSGSTAGAFDLPPEAEEPNPEADLVASKLLGFLIKAFIDKVPQIELVFTLSLCLTEIHLN
jgi:hypothetical protein